MSVSTIEAGVIRIGDGVTNTYSFSFEARSTADIKVSNVVLNALVPVPSGFVVTINPNGVGGSVIFSVPPEVGLEFYIFRDTSLTQLVSVSSQGKYDPNVVEGVWDKLTFLAQELAAEVERAIKVVPGSTADELLAAIFSAQSATANSAAQAAASAAAAAVFDPSFYALKLTTTLVTAGTNAQGQAPLTNDLNAVTVTAANPSGVTLPIPTVGRRVTVTNRGTNPINVYPSAGVTIATQAVNTPYSINVGQSLEVFASSLTQWELVASTATIDADLQQIAAPTYVRGDLIRRGASVMERLALGAAGSVLGSDGTDALWTFPDLFFRNNAAFVGVNATGAQPLFPVNPTLLASSVYQYEIFFGLSKTAGATSHAMALGFDGNVISIHRSIGFNFATSGLTFAASLAAAGYVTNLPEVTVASGIASAVVNAWNSERGTLVTGGAPGIVRPTYTLFTAPGGAYSTIPGSFFRLRRLGPSGGNNQQGTWS